MYKLLLFWFSFIFLSEGALVGNMAADPAIVAEIQQLLSDRSGSKDVTETLSDVATELRHELDVSNTEKIRLMSESRLKDQTIHEYGGEIERLNSLVHDMKMQHMGKMTSILSDREKVASKIQRVAEENHRHETARLEAEEELKSSLQEREKLSKLVEKQMQESEEMLFKLHQQQDKADEWQARYESITSDKEGEDEELMLLREDVEFHRKYIQELTKQRDGFQQHTRKLESELKEVILRRDDAQHVLNDSTPLLPQSILVPQPERPGSINIHPPVDTCQGYRNRSVPAVNDREFYSQYDETDDPQQSLFVNDPLSPIRDQHHHHYYYENSPQENSPNQQSEDVTKMNNRLSKLQAEISVKHVNDSIVQDEYITEAKVKLAGSLAALETLCSAIADWGGCISAGRTPWGGLDSLDASLAEKRIRESERRATLKREVQRMIDQTDAGSVIDIYFSSGRLRAAVTMAMESFQTAKESADATMNAARTTLSQSLEATRAQAGSMTVALSDASNVDARMRELTEAKLEAERQIIQLERQVEERKGYQEDIERISKQMKDEAEEERKKMSEIALEMTAKQKDELLRMANKHREQLSELTKDSDKSLQRVQQQHTEQVAELSAQLQDRKNKIEDLQTVIEEKDRKVAVAIAKKKTQKSITGALQGEISGLKQALGSAMKDIQGGKYRNKHLEKECMVLKDLSAKLESDVRRGKIIIDGESERNLFSAWKKAQLRSTPDDIASVQSGHTNNISEQRRRSDWTYYSANTPPRALKKSHVHAFV